MEIKTNRLGFVDYMGLEAVTVHDGKPFFFLFDEIDNHDEEELRQHLAVFAERQLTFIWYKSNKGYHIISLSLLDLKSWDSARKELQRISKNYYPHLVIRISRKQNDSRDLYFENLDISQKFVVSDSLCQLYEKRFLVSIPVKNRVKTILLFTQYSQLNLK